MTYSIARDGKIYGPYSTAEVVRHIASGYILPTDLAQGDGQQEWFPVEELFPAERAASPVYPGGMTALYADPPDLPCWMAMLLDIFTLGVFFVVWDIVETAWMRKISKQSTALWLYIAAAVLFVLNLPSMWNSVAHVFFDAPAMETSYAGLFSIAAIVLRLIARFVFRGQLCRHFNGPEPIGLKLNWLMTLFFGGLYFQYHFNRVNQMKRALRISVPAV